MYTPPKALIFDFGNVLFAWDPRQVYKDYFSNQGAIDAFFEEIDFFAWNLEQDKGRPFADGVTLLSARFPQYAHLIHIYNERWEDSMLSPIAGAIELVRRLKYAQHPLYLLTNFSCEKFALMRQRCDFLQLFDDLIISSEHHLVKPDPAIFRLTLKRINRPAHECVFIDDSRDNIETARSLGFVTIHFQSAAQLETELRQRNILQLTSETTQLHNLVG